MTSVKVTRVPCAAEALFALIETTPRPAVGGPEICPAAAGSANIAAEASAASTTAPFPRTTRLIALPSSMTLPQSSRRLSLDGRTVSAARRVPFTGSSPAGPRPASRCGEARQACNLGRAARGQLLDHADAPDVELLVDHAGLEARPLERAGGVREGAARDAHGAREVDDPVLVL